MPNYSGNLFATGDKCPAQPTAAITVEKRIVDQDACSLEVELENHLAKTLYAKSVPNVLLASLLTVQEQEPPAAGASDLAP